METYGPRTVASRVPPTVENFTLATVDDRMTIVQTFKTVTSWLDNHASFGGNGTRRASLRWVIIPTPGLRKGSRLEWSTVRRSMSADTYCSSSSWEFIGADGFGPMFRTVERPTSGPDAVLVDRWECAAATDDTAEWNRVVGEIDRDDNDSVAGTWISARIQDVLNGR